MGHVGAHDVAEPGREGVHRRAGGHDGRGLGLRERGDARGHHRADEGAVRELRRRDDVGCESGVWCVLLFLLFSFSFWCDSVLSGVDM